MLQEIEIKEYLSGYIHIPVVDVRSPVEFKRGHIPGAYNVPLFSDKERETVGTVYKQRSKEKAYELAYGFVEPKKEWFIKQSSEIATNNELVVHCWRGGMRSKSFAQHIEANGIKKVYVIKQGYKAFRRILLKSFDEKPDIIILGGYTGSGKTEILKELLTLNQQAIDLEFIAGHKGSAYGAMGRKVELTTEQFENNLFWKWKDLSPEKPVWLEDESAIIGPVHIPANLFARMRKAPVVFIDIPKEERAKFLVKDYEVCDKQVLIENTMKIKKRLGDLNARLAVSHIENENYYDAAIIILNYYDKYYKKGLLNRNDETVFKLELFNTQHKENAEKILHFVNQHNGLKM